MKVGDYVRTKNGYIGKIYNINEFREPSMMYAIDIPTEDDFIFMRREYFKSSPNIIDLIEVGDYVNGLPVIKIEINEDGERYIYVGEENTTFGWLVYYDIKSIVTKEQFESMEYRIGE